MDDPLDWTAQFDEGQRIPLLAWLVLAIVEVTQAKLAHVIE